MFSPLFELSHALLKRGTKRLLTFNLVKLFLALTVILRELLFTKIVFSEMYLQIIVYIIYATGEVILK